MARKLVVEIIGDASSLNRSLKEATVASNRFGKEVSHSLRGVASGTGIMHSFGRSLAFASGGFLAFEGVSHLLSDSVKAAIDAGVAQRSLTAQMKASGESFAASSHQIEQANLGLAKFGFTSEDAEHALTVLERGTGNIQRALSLETVSADIARAKNIDLAAAANVVAKVFGGQETALRRAVPGLSKQAHGLDLIAQAQKRLAGQAAAATTPGERFNATLHDTEVIIGTALLPTLNKYLTSLTEWLERMNRSGQLQRDVTGAVKVATGAIDAAKTVVDAAAGAFRTLNTVTGSTKDTLKLLFSAFVAFKTLKLAATFAQISGSIRGVGTAAEGSTGKVTGLRGALGSLPALVATTVAVDIVMSAHTTEHGLHRYSGSKGWANLFHDLAHPERLFQNLTGGGGGPAGTTGGNLFSPNFKLPNITANIPIPPVPVIPPPHDLPTHAAAAAILGRGALTPMQRAQLALSSAALTKSTKDDLAALVAQRVLLARAIRTETARLNQATTADAAKGFADNLQALQAKDAAAMNQILSITQQGARDAKRTGAEIATQRNAWFDSMINRALGRVQDIPTVQGQIARLQQISGLITKRIGATRDITRKLNLEDQQLDVIRQIRADRVQAAQDTLDARSARQFKALGLDATGGDLPPTVKALQTQAAQVRKALGSMADAKTRQTLAGIGRVLGGGIGKVTDEVKAKIKELLDTLTGSSTVDPLAGLRQVSSKRLANILAAGTGLNAQGRRTLGMNIAGAEIQPVHVHVHLDGREVATVVSKQQARTSPAHRRSRPVGFRRG